MATQRSGVARTTYSRRSVCRFARLLFSPHYVDVDADGVALRRHYVDEGPKAAPAVLLLHGEPSWSYLYRHMIPVLTAARLRTVAIDLVGFGRSDKPADRTDYTYQAHVDCCATQSMPSNCEISPSATR